MTNFFKKVINIADAFLHPLPIDEKWYQDRISICATCPYNSENVEEKSKTKTQKFREKHINVCPEVRFCTACGCCIDRKCAVPAEICGAVDKGEKPKWDAIITADTSNKGVQIVNNSPERMKISREGVRYIFDLGVTAEPLVEFSFDVHTPDSYKYRSVVVGCGCTVVNGGEQEPSVYKFPVKLSTVNFPKGAKTEKNVSLYFDDGNISRTINIRLKITKS